MSGHENSRHLPEGVPNNSDEPRAVATGLSENPEVRFETSDVDASSLLKYGFWLVVTTAVVVVLLWRLYFVFVAQEAARQPPPPVMKVDPEAMTVPLPNLQTLPALDLSEFRAREDSVLHSYGWVDKQASVVRIPIEEAMRILAERGLPQVAPPGTGGPAAAKTPAPEAKR
jgi:hypothetical protein